MAYVKNTWVDQDVERPKTYEVTTNQDGSITLTDSFGLVTELGTPVNAVNMNHIEDGLALSDLMKYDATVTYNTGEWVTGVVDNEKGIYASKVNNNTGNALTNDTYWEKVELGGGATRNIGEIVASTIPLTDAGLHLLDGALLQYGSYQAFIDYIAELYDSGDYDDIFETEANWQASVTQYGVCGKFVYDSTNNTVRLPKITGIIEGTTDLTALGDLVEAGLPNIVGNLDFYSGRGTGTGAITYTKNSSENNPGGGDMLGNCTLNFNASRSSAIYGNSNTVQPQTIKVLYYIVIATSTKTDIEVDIDEIATDLNGKADVDLTNVNNSGTSRGAFWAMPSTNYTDLTVGAVGASYTAPATGWVYLQANSTTDMSTMTIENTTNNIRCRANVRVSGWGLTCYVPVSKNDTFAITDWVNANVERFRFYYANGSESEAQ